LIVHGLESASEYDYTAFLFIAYSCILVGERDFDHELGALAVLAYHIDGASVQFSNATHQG
jgi:hypothetical protein